MVVMQICGKNIGQSIIKELYMNVLNAFQKKMGTQGIGISYKNSTGIYTKYFLFSQIKAAEKYYNTIKKAYGNKVDVHFNRVIY